MKITKIFNTGRTGSNYGRICFSLLAAAFAFLIVPAPENLTSVFSSCAFAEETAGYASGTYTANAGTKDGACTDKSGILRFSGTSGEWIDYDGSSMQLSGTVSCPEDGKREIRLYSRFFSETVPLLTAEIEPLDGVGYKCLSGYIFSYPIREWEMLVEETEIMFTELDNTLIITKPGEYGHLYTPEQGTPGSTEFVDYPVNVMRLSGSCRNENGGFDYVIELTDYIDNGEKIENSENSGS